MGNGYNGCEDDVDQTSEHEALEAELADFMQKEDSFLLNFGYQGCQSAIEALVTRHVHGVYDSESHACTGKDNVRLHQGKEILYINTMILKTSAKITLIELKQ